MTQASRRPRSFPLRWRWLPAGSARSRSNHGHQCGESLLMHSEQPPRHLLHAPDLSCDPIRTSHPASVASTIEVGAAIKSP
jgi:hypothetical protein